MALGVDRGTVGQWIRSEKLPARKIGRVYFMNEEDIKSYATSHGTSKLGGTAALGPDAR